MFKQFLPNPKWILFFLKQTFLQIFRLLWYANVLPNISTSQPLKSLHRPQPMGKFAREIWEATGWGHARNSGFTGRKQVVILLQYLKQNLWMFQWNNSFKIFSHGAVIFLNWSNSFWGVGGGGWGNGWPTGFSFSEFSNCSNQGCCWTVRISSL